MRWRTLVVGALSLTTLALTAAPAMAAGKGTPNSPIKVGPVVVNNAEDIGTCNNVWALDSYNKFYALSANKDGTYTINVDFRQGRFETTDGANPYGGIAYASPGACEDGSYNGNTVAAGVRGNMHETWEATVIATSAPNRSPDCSVFNGCQTASDFLAAVFGTGNATSDGWTYAGHYEAGSNGVWFDTMTNWPLNDRGDITS